MFGWFRRKPGVQEYAAALNPRRIRRLMKAANNTMQPPEGFEATVSAHVIPMFGAEIAESQSLKQAREASRVARVAAHPFKRGRR